MTTRRAVEAELREAGCTREESDLFLLVQRIPWRRERARRVERAARAVGAALARIVAWPVELLLPGR